MKIRSTSLAMAAMMSAGFLAAPINVLAKAPEMPQGIYAQPFADGEQAAAKEKHYELKCELKKESNPNQDSSAAGAIKKAVAVEKDGKWTFTITTQPTQVLGATGLIEELYYYEDGAVKSIKATQNGNDWSFTLEGKPDSIKLQFKINVMPVKPNALLNILEYNEVKTEEPLAPGTTPEQPNTHDPSKPNTDEPATPGTTPENPSAPDPSKPNTGETTPEQKPEEEKPKEENPQDKKDNQSRSYELPVKLVKVDGGKSMAASAINKTAKVEIANGRYTYYVQFIPMKMMGMEGHLTNLFYYDGTEKRQATSQGNGLWSFTLNEKVESQKIAIWVDIMDEMQGGPGKGEQDACLKFDFSGIDEDKPEDGDKKPGGEGQTPEKPKDGNETKPEDGNKDKPKDGNETKPKDENKDKPKDEKPLDKKEDTKKDQTLRYELPVTMMRVGGGKSMAASALSTSATVDAYNGRYTYYVQFKPLKMNNMEGRLTNLFYYDGGAKRRASYHGDGLWSFTLQEKVQSQRIALWVDIMDELQGGKPGAGEQDAYLQFDWNSARETRRIDGEVKTPEKQTEEKKTEDKKKEEQKSAEDKKKESLKVQEEAERSAILKRFNDVGADHWAVDAIAHSVARGYFKGEGNSRFAPNRAITRAEFVTILGRKAGITPSGASTAFRDVKADAYYAPYVAWAESKGIVKGTGFGKFEPNRTITREEMAVILDKFLADQKKTYPSTVKTQFNDAGTVSSWAKESVEKMADQGLLSGVGKGNFVPKGSFTRAQAAQVLYTIDTKDMK